MREVHLTLKVIEPDRSVRVCSYAKPAELVVGRGEDCDIQLPMDQFHSHVSRHHCVIHIDPPAIRVRDLGSRNGTFLNGANIGQRPLALRSDEGTIPPAPVRELRDGDEVRIGFTRIRVAIESDAPAREPVYPMSFV